MYIYILYICAKSCPLLHGTAVAAARGISPGDDGAPDQKSGKGCTGGLDPLDGLQLRLGRFAPQ